MECGYGRKLNVLLATRMSENYCYSFCATLTSFFTYTQVCQKPINNINHQNKQIKIKIESTWIKHRNLKHKYINMSRSIIYSRGNILYRLCMHFLTFPLGLFCRKKRSREQLLLKDFEIHLPQTMSRVHSPQPTSPWLLLLNFSGSLALRYH